MEPERIELSAKERERLKVLHEVEQGHLKQIEAARRLRLTDRHVRRLQVRLRQEGDRGMVHRLRGRHSNRQIPKKLKQQTLDVLRQARYAGFGPTLASEHLARQGQEVSRETLRAWMSEAGLWQPHALRLKSVPCLEKEARGLRRTGDDGQLTLSLAGKAWLGLPPDCFDR
jgi:hypothetical protein